MGLIEQAARRLEELRRAGIQVPAHPESPQRDLQEAAPAPREPADPPLRAVQREPEPDAAAEARTLRRPPAPRHVIDLEKLARRGFVTPNVPRSRIAEEFRILKRPLIANATPGQATSARNGNLIMVTSSVPAEGKTFTSVNLAMSIASEVDRRVLLVDADVPRPSLPGTLGVPPGRGLIDVLTGQCRDVGELIARTNVAKLSFLPSGSMHEGAAELLASDGMSRLVRELGQRYPDRIVIFDSPPILAATESRVLASHMGQILFVVHAEKTLRTEVERALAALADACPIKLIVLNAATLPAQDGYGYRYGYGYGADRE